MSTIRSLFTTACVRANDLTDVDVFLLDGAWRAIFDVHTQPSSVLELYASTDRDRIHADAQRVRLDCWQDGNQSRYHTDVTRPGHKPWIINAHRMAVSVDGEPCGGSAPMETEAVIAALLSTNEYTAVRFVRDETADGVRVEDGWAVYRHFDLVTIQIPDHTRQAPSVIPSVPDTHPAPALEGVLR